MSERKQSPRVLAVTAQRPEEIVMPLAQIEWTTEILTVDASVGPLERSTQAARRTRHALRTFDPDILLLDCHETIGAPVTFVARRHNIPVVVRLVGNMWRKLEEERIKPARARLELRRYTRHQVSYLLNRYIFRQASGFIAVSRELAEVIECRTGCPRNRIYVVPVPITTDIDEQGSAVTAKKKLGIEGNQLILTVTNLLFRAKLHGVQTIISDILGLLKEKEDLAYLVAGGGRYHEELVTWIDETIEDPAVRERVYTPGYVDEVTDLYALGDVFVYVSYLDGYPKAVLEAQTARLPVVANEAHGMRDQIKDGETGLLVDPTKSGSIRDRVVFLLKNPQERLRIGEQARSRALQENSPGVIGQKLSIIFDDLVNKYDSPELMG